MQPQNWHESMADMGSLVAIATAVFAALLLMAFLIGRLFQSKKIRKRIMVGTIALYVVVALGYFGFIAYVLSGNLN
jgi:predicted permease